jgi:hypothetical protein
MQQEIIVRRIFDTRNPNIKTLELKTRVLKPASANPVGFLLQGLYSNYEERVAFTPVSTTFLEMYKIEVGSDFGKAISQPCKIVVREGFSPFRMTRVNGELVPQEPKKVPGIASNIYLCKDGQPIYRHTILTMNPTEFDDVYIAHDPISEEDKETIRRERTDKTNREELYTFNPNIMTEPELD